MLKMLKVIPTYKDKGTNLDCANNYRPISLL